MRAWCAAALLLALQGSAFAADPVATPAGTQCDSPEPPGDLREVTCKLGASNTARRFRFTANFGGGHDDTVASMTATLDDAPLTCDDGSKTRLMGEDGNVSLHCRFAVPAAPGRSPVLRVTLLWSHAQYTDFQIRTD